MFRVEIDIVTGEETVNHQSLYKNADGELIAVDEGNAVPEGFLKNEQEQD